MYVNVCAYLGYSYFAYNQKYMYFIAMTVYPYIEIKKIIFSFSEVLIYTYCNVPCFIIQKVSFEKANAHFLENFHFQVACILGTGRAPIPCSAFPQLEP